MVDINLYENTEDINGNIINNELHLFLQEVELAIQIGPNEIWGVGTSINISRYVFNKYVTIAQIKNEMRSFISKNCYHAKSFSWNLDVEIIKNPNGVDLLYIKFTVTTDGLGDDYIQKFLVGAST